MPAWTYQQIKAADAALDPPVADLQAAADALNTQTVQLVNRPIPWATIKRTGRLSATGDWSRIVARSRQTPGMPPTTAADASILAAINCVAQQDQDVIDPSDAAAWATFSAGLQTLQSAGDVSQNTADAILALATVVVPAWTPRLSAGDVQTARAQP